MLYLGWLFYQVFCNVNILMKYKESHCVMYYLIRHLLQGMGSLYFCKSLSSSVIIVIVVNICSKLYIYIYKNIGWAVYLGGSRTDWLHSHQRCHTQLMRVSISTIMLLWPWHQHCNTHHFQSCYSISITTFCIQPRYCVIWDPCI